MDQRFLIMSRRKSALIASICREHTDDPARARNPDVVAVIIPEQ